MRRFTVSAGGLNHTPRERQRDTAQTHRRQSVAGQLPRRGGARCEMDGGGTEFNPPRQPLLPMYYLQLCVERPRAASCQLAKRGRERERPDRIRVEGSNGSRVSLIPFVRWLLVGFAVCFKWPVLAVKCFPLVAGCLQPRCQSRWSALRQWPTESTLLVAAREAMQ